ncbi:MAG: hypothetical protein HY870_14085 [Chloroflexi bacterium]|nr:hypothetical protein [Chloroflexota bacterium]
MSDSSRSGGVDVDGEVTVGEDIVGRDKITSTTNNIYAGLSVGEIFRLRLVLTYERLWGMLAPLAKYGRTRVPTYEVARDLAERLRSWYYEEAGGLYLAFSTENVALEAYNQLQEILARAEDRSISNELIVPADLFAEIRLRGSKLRISMASEIRTYMQSSD